MSTQMMVRIEPELKKKVNSLAKSEGKTTSEIVRELLEDYVRTRDMGAYIDELWIRIGTKLSSQGVDRSKIRRAIQEIRGRQSLKL